MNIATYQLDDRYDRTTGRVYLTGTQALVRIMLDQARRDRAAGITQPASSRAIAARRSAASTWRYGASAGV